MTDLFGTPPEEPAPPKRTASDWELRARTAVMRLEKGWRGTGEDIRMEVAKAGVEKPATPNAWGSFTKKLIDQGYLMRTGKRRPMREMKSHGRMTDVYERT